MTVLSMTDARQDLSRIANQVAFGGERICIEKNGKLAFAMISIEDLEVLEALEDKLDVKEALRALKEPGSISLKDFRKKLGS